MFFEFGDLTTDKVAQEMTAPDGLLRYQLRDCQKTMKSPSVLDK